MRKFTYWLVGLAIIGIAIGAVLLLNNIREIPSSSAENARCEPTLADAGGVDISSAFRFTFAGDVSAHAVRRSLSVEPDIELNFHQGLQAKEVLTVPVEPLQPGQIYRFSLQTEAATIYWAFQTKQEWRVKESVPAYGDITVSPHSALEIYFNQSLSVDLETLPDFFATEPSITGRFEQAGNCLRFIPAEPLAALTIYTVTLAAGLPAANSDLSLAEEYGFTFETGNSDGSAYQALWSVNTLSSFSPEQFLVFNCDFFDLKDPAPAELEEESDEELEGETKDPIEKPIEKLGPALNVTLYRYPDTKAYAEDILASLRQTPIWSCKGSFPQGADVSSLTSLFSQELNAQAMESGWRFSLPTTLPPDCYLLQASYRGQSRDIRFQISPLTAFIQTSLEESLFWVHTAQGGPAADCLITHINSGASGQTDEDGLLRLGLLHELIPLGALDQLFAKQDVYLLSHGLDELVLADFDNLNAKQLQAGADIWQYLVLNKDIYNSDDTLEFWGYMRRRDNMAWEWNRVTVYVCAAKGLTAPVLQGYAPLSGNIFYGSLQLPRLLPGPYELQIWQSGQVLISKSFTVQAAPERLNQITEENALSLGGDKDTYALNEEYTLNVEGAPFDADGYLFIKSGYGIKEALVGQEAQCSGVFSLDDLGGSYWRAVTFEKGRYTPTPFYNLLAESSSRALRIEAAVRERYIRFTVRDAAGNAPDKTALLAVIAPPGRSIEDTVAALYAPNRISSLFGWVYLPNSSEAPASWSKESLLFESLSTDKNGRAELELPANLPPGEWQLYAWAMADDSLPLAGSVQLPLAMAPAPDPVAPLIEEEAEWLFIGNNARVQAIEILCQALTVAGDDIEQYWSAIYAANILADLRPGALPPTIEETRFKWTDYQQPDGGISPRPAAPVDMLLSMLAASLEGQAVSVCDKAVLGSYLMERAMITPTLAERAMALAGLAALGQPILQEIKQMLGQEILPPATRACLIWGLTQAGDIQAAKDAFQDLLSAHVSYTASGALYLEGGEGENLLLNILGAMTAAACGDAYTASELLRYLQNQQAPGPLTATLAAGAVLRHCYAAPATASLKLSWRFQQVEIKGFHDFWLEMRESSQVNLGNVSGDIGYTIIRFPQGNI